MKAAIIGGGLAGTACAYVLRQNGVEAEIYESGPDLAGGASGNPSGLYNPRLSAHRTAESDYYTAAFSLALRTFRIFTESGGDVGWERCGVLHMATDEKRRRRFSQTVQNWGWDPDHMRYLDVRQASDVAGVALGTEALCLPDAGRVSPKKLCRLYAKDAAVLPDREIGNITDIDADVKILACGFAVKNFPETAFLPVYPVRGQITEVRATPLSSQLRCALCYGGYISPAHEGVHMLGASFQRHSDDSSVYAEDDQSNLEGLRLFHPALADGLEVIGHRAAVRTASKDHFPVVGAVPGHDDTYVSVAHGSHGILSSLMAAHLLADMILKRPACLSAATIRRLSPARFTA